MINIFTVWDFMKSSCAPPKMELFCWLWPKKKKILVIPLLRTERETECNIVVKGKYTAELLRDVIFLLFLYMLYILQIIQLEVEWNEPNQSSARETFIRIMKC